ncbi:MAG: N-acetylneuraminate synthase [Clostridia bacterium]
MPKVLIIAEAGVNHNGSLEVAKQMVDAAKECGADIIKFQTSKLDALVSKFAPMAEYQKKNTQKNESQKEMLKSLALDFDEFTALARYCREREIEFLSTPFDIDSVRFLEPLVRLWKIPSGEITNLPYLLEVARTGKDVILSTGMSDIEEVREAFEVLRKNGAGNVTLLHCTTQYPTDFSDVNLRAMLTLRKQFQVKTGYSDHTRGIEIPIAAVALGASVIEKHFTLSRDMEGPDHKASLEPDELKQMIISIRNVEQAMGDGDKQPVPSELGNIIVARKSIVALKDIKKGELFTEENITTKRPGNGISPMRWFDILGTKACRDFREDELIEL